MKRFVVYMLVFISIVAQGQSTSVGTFLYNNKKKADFYYLKKAYRNALEIYLHMVDKESGNVYARQRVADCYLALQNPVEAERWYHSIMEDPQVLPETRYQYARVLCMNKKYKEALRVLEKINKRKVDSLLLTRQIDFIKNIDYYLRDSMLFIVGNTESLNSPESDYGVTYFRDDIVFVSSRDSDLFIKHKSLSAVSEHEAPANLFHAHQDVDGTFGPVHLFRKEELKTEFHDGPIDFYHHDKKVAFTRTNFNDRKPIVDIAGNANLKLYLADMAHFGELKNITPFPFNNDGYSVGHATFTRNGERIFFSSTHPNGFGGSDIYYSDLINGQWADPVNVGPVVNTAGDELYPHLKNDSTLYFASNGHGGFGGLDIYLTNRKKGQFTTPHNLGHPVNSSYDDFSMVSDSTGRVGFFSSNRPGGKGQDDIYLFVSLYTFLEGEARDMFNQNQVVPGTYIEVRDENGNLVDSMTTKGDGSFHLDLPYDRDFTLSAKKNGYELLEDIGLTTKGLPFGIDSLMLPMWKHALYAKGRIFNNETQLLLPDATVLLKNLTDNTTDTLKVDETGRYEFVVLPNHEFRIEATKPGFIADGFNLNTKDLYKGELLNDIVLEEQYLEKAVIFFDYNKGDIKLEWERLLAKVLRTLKKYPTSTVHIGAHADSRGARQYNQMLSTKRAKSVADFFVSKGIARSRIESVGFGEELILNRCSDGVVCDEEDHSKNRRAEVKVQGKSIVIEPQK